MSSSHNPYAAPSADTDFGPPRSGFEEGVYRDGQFLVIPARGTSLPGRCVVCNAPAQARLTRKLYWHAPGYYLLIVLGALIYVIVALIVRNRAHFELGLCEKHVRRRRIGILIGWVGPIVCFALLFFSPDSKDNNTWSHVLFALGMIGSLVTGILMARVVSAHHIDEHRAWLRVGRPFLDSF